MTTPKDPVQAALSRLSTLITSSGENYYERITLVAQLLGDHHWITTQFSGNDHDAATMIEDKYLHDICSTLTIWDLLSIYRKFPTKASWEKYNYNLRLMFHRLKQDTLAAKESSPVVSRRSVKTSDFDALKTEKHSLEAKLKHLASQLKEQGTELEQARTKIKKLEKDNSILNGRLIELERVLDKLSPKQKAA